MAGYSRRRCRGRSLRVVALVVAAVCAAACGAGGTGQPIAGGAPSLGPASGGRSPVPTRWFSEGEVGLSLGAVVPADPDDPGLGRLLAGLPAGPVYAFVLVTNDTEQEYTAGALVVTSREGSTATFRPLPGRPAQPVVAAHARLRAVWVTDDEVGDVVGVRGPRGEPLGRVDG